MHKIFIIEKDRYTSEVLAESLLSLNYEPVIFNYDQSIADALIAVNPYIVIINMQLYKNNRELFISLMAPKQKLLDACLIITSANLIDPESIREYGADFFLFKPYGLADLNSVLQRVEISKCHSTVVE